MKKVLLLTILIFSFVYATEYRVTNLKPGAFLNVRTLPLVNARTIAGKIPSDAMGIEIRECRYDTGGREWCYISYLVGADYLEGWVSRKFLAPMDEEEASVLNLSYIKNFLNNYYMGEEKNFLDKLTIYHYFPMQQYMYKKNLSHLALRNEKVKFYKRWPKRTYKLGTVQVIKREPTFIDVKCTVFWRFDHGEEYERGQDVHKVRLIRDENRLKILALKPLSHVVYPKPVEIEDQNATDSNNTAGDGYYVKAGSFLENPSADYLLKITQLGFTYSIDQIQSGDRQFYRVFIGPFSTPNEASAALQTIQQQINKDAFIQTNR